MRTYTNEPTEQSGYCFLIYSKPNYGKTHSFGTLQGKTKLIVTEPKDSRSVLGYAGENVDYVECDNFDEYMELLVGMEREAREGTLAYDNIGFDSLSFLQSRFELELEDNRYEARTEKEKARAGLIDRFRIDQADWGGLASILIRISSSLNRLSKYGKVCIATATEVENPKFDMSVTYAPSFTGRKFPSVVNGFFDLIGRVIEPWAIREDGTVRPPAVSFVSDNGDFIARCTGKLAPKGKRLPLDYAKILNVLRKG